MIKLSNILKEIRLREPKNHAYVSMDDVKLGMEFLIHDMENYLSNSKNDFTEIPPDEMGYVIINEFYDLIVFHIKEHLKNNDNEIYFDIESNKDIYEYLTNIEGSDIIQIIIDELIVPAGYKLITPQNTKYFIGSFIDRNKSTGTEFINQTHISDPSLWKEYIKDGNGFDDFLDLIDFNIDKIINGLNEGDINSILVNELGLPVEEFN